MTRTIECKKCGAHIDRTAFGNNYSHITIFTDDGKKRVYLCDDCTRDMDLLYI